MDHSADDYHRGEMDIHEQASTYKAFLSISKWFSLVLAATLFFLVLLFIIGAGFIGASATFVVIMVLGVLLLRSKPQSH